MITFISGFVIFSGIIVYCAWASARHADQVLAEYFKHKETHDC